MAAYLYVALGSALGGIARFGSGRLIAGWLGSGFPWGTLFVNVLGSLAIGALATLIPADGRLFGLSDARALLVAGLCGGFTTFSAFSLETLTLARHGEWLSAGGYILASVILCLAAVTTGYVGMLALQR